MRMEKKERFVSALPSRMVPLRTAETPAFRSLEKNVGLWNSKNGGKGLNIIGLIDRGITTKRPSFRGKKMPPPPAKWKDKCHKASLCSNKLISLRNFALDSNNTSDEFMHVTHTTSTTAGSPIEGVSFFG